jgi:hypothetical protein
MGMFDTVVVKFPPYEGWEFQTKSAYRVMDTYVIDKDWNLWLQKYREEPLAESDWQDWGFGLVVKTKLVPDKLVPVYHIDKLEMIGPAPQYQRYVAEFEGNVLFHIGIDHDHPMAKKEHDA